MATDRMITVRQPNIEYEQKGITKALEISPSCLAATAGSALAFSPILRDAVLEINKKSINDISQIAEIVRKCYSGHRSKKLEENVLSSVGLSLQGFYQTNQALQPQLAATLFQAMQRFNYQLWILIAGTDEHGGHLWHIENPGKKECLDNIGFHAVGSGQHHAISTFIANEFEPTIDLSHGLAITFEAKKRSEKATGVGKLTDIVIISENGHKRLNEKEISQLETLYAERVDIEKKAIKTIDKKLEELDFLSNYQ